jgi:hypothetical protein
MKRFHDVAEFVRNDGLGKLDRIECFIPPNNRHCGATWQPEPVPAGLELGHVAGALAVAARTPRSAAITISASSATTPTARSPTGRALPRTSVSWALDKDDSGPVEVEGHGEFPSSGLFTNATKVDFTVRYANGVPMHCRTR